MSTPKVILLNRTDAVNYKPEGKAIAIRLDSQYPLRDLKGNYEGILVKTFEDTEEESVYSMTDQDAKDIVEFVLKNLDVDEIMVHCHYKQGRSPAAAIAIEEFFGGFQSHYEEEFPSINKMVLEKLRLEFKKSCIA